MKIYEDFHYSKYDFLQLPFLVSNTFLDTLFSNALNR
jgi:hypothetical protein